MDKPDDAAIEVSRLEELRARAIVEANRDALDSITDEDYLHIDSTGRVRTKAQFLDGLDGRQGRFVSYSVETDRISILGTTAVVTGAFANRLKTADGTDTVKRARHVRVYLLGARGWRNILHQATEIMDDVQPGCAADR